MVLGARTQAAIGAQPPRGRALDVGYTSPRSMICVRVNNGNPHVETTTTTATATTTTTTTITTTATTTTKFCVV